MRTFRRHVLLVAMKVLYKNATILTQNQSREVIDVGFVSVVDGYISDVSVEAPDNSVFDQVINLGGKWLLPGFVNPHVHLGESVYFPFINRKLSLSGYLERTEEVYASNEEIGRNRELVCKYSLYQLIQNGTTTIGGGRVTQTATEFQIPNTSGYMLMNSAKLGHFSDNALENFLKKRNEETIALNKHCIFIHSLSRIGRDEINVVKKLKNELRDLIVMIHVEEDESESNIVREKWGDSSIQVLENEGILDSKTFLIHGNHLSNSDLDIVASAGATLCHCVTSNLTVADRVIDITKALERKINLVVATDGPITGAGFNILNEVRKVYQYQNRFLNEEKVSPQACLDMITINAANAVGQSDVSGSIETGKLANFVICEPPFEVKPQEIVNMLIRYELIDVFGVVINGERVVWDRNLIVEDWKKTQLAFSNLIESI